MKNLLGFVKENKKAIGLIAGAIATLIVGKKVSKKINAKMEKVEKDELAIYVDEKWKKLKKNIRKWTKL